MNGFVSEAFLSQIDAQRTLRGLMTVTELLQQLGERRNIILDPFSILVGKDVEIGSGNILYPNVVIETRNGGTISIGDENIFLPGAMLLADRGKIVIGSVNEFGDGGARIKANMPTAFITFGNNGRYMNNVEIMGQCNLGSGSQILGAISVQNCILGGGESYKQPDAKTRGGLLKGFGLARNLTVAQGEVINGQGDFSLFPVEQQAAYHPPKT